MLCDPLVQSGMSFALAEVLTCSQRSSASGGQAAAESDTAAAPGQKRYSICSDFIPYSGK